MKSQEQDFLNFELAPKTDPENKQIKPIVSLFDRLIFPEEDHYQQDSSIILYQPQPEPPKLSASKDKLEEQTPLQNNVVEISSNEPRLRISDVKQQTTLGQQIGCKCRKNRCQRGYCPCYKKGKRCQQDCRCLGCKNMMPKKKKIKKCVMTPFWSVNDLEEVWL